MENKKGGSLVTLISSVFFCHSGVAHVIENHFRGKSIKKLGTLLPFNGYFKNLMNTIDIRIIEVLMKYKTSKADLEKERKEIGFTEWGQNRQFAATKLV